MGVVEAKIQTVEDIYRLIWTAVANKQPISAIYKERPRLFCPHRLGRNQAGPASRALLSIWRGERERFSAHRLTGELALHRVGETAGRGTAGRFVEDRTKSFPSGHLCRRGRYRCRGSTGARSAKGTVRNPPEQVTGQDHSQSGDRTRIMPLGTNAANRAAGSPAAARGAGSPRLPTRAEGEKRFRSATRNP